jgi:hypothetical protein
MDEASVKFSEEQFNDIRQKLSDFLKTLGFKIDQNFDQCRSLIPAVIYRLLKTLSPFIHDIGTKVSLLGLKLYSVKKSQGFCRLNDYFRWS